MSASSLSVLWAPAFRSRRARQATGPVSLGRSRSWVGRQEMGQRRFLPRAGLGERRARAGGGRHVAADEQPRVCVREYQGLYWAQLRTGIQRRIQVRYPL